MILKVPHAAFVETCKRMGITESYCEEQHGSTHVTALVPNSIHSVHSEFPMSLADTQGILSPTGIGAYEGHWQDSDSPQDSWPHKLHIAAVSYKSDKHPPGIWVDAYLSEPTPAQVLKSIYDEFRETGELLEVSMEEFVRLATPNVVIVSPSNIRTYLDSKSESESE